MAELYALTGAQVRMARAFLRWSVADLARNAKVGISTVQRIEASDGGPTVDDVQWACRSEGAGYRGGSAFPSTVRYHVPVQRWPRRRRPG